ncbi:MAG TPA: rRNA maturation RNase YbeY [Steroidobacteraceae bacterium]
MASEASRELVSLTRRERSGWVPGQRELARWASTTLGPRARDAQISVLLVGAARSRSLNRRYRGRDYPTNVLSFAPSAMAAGRPRLLGDLVICPQVLRREARQQHKTERAHFMHLFVHGLLHLLGYDHQRAAGARRMERREVRTLKRLGVANPYRSH